MGWRSSFIIHHYLGGIEEEKGLIVFDRRGKPDIASEWVGWRVGNLRPTFEPILWVVKPYPIGTTIADNALSFEVGPFNETAFLRYEQSPDNVLRSGFAPGEPGLHPTQKPVRLLQALIELTTKPGQLVLDPFCGSGSTLVAAHHTGREFVGFEQKSEFYDVARDRLAADLFSTPPSSSALG